MAQNNAKHTTRAAISVLAALMVAAGVTLAAVAILTNGNRDPTSEAKHPGGLLEAVPNPQRPPTVPPLARPTDTAPAPAGATVTRIGPSGARLIIPALEVIAPLYPIAAQGPLGDSILNPPADIATVGWWDGAVVTADHQVDESVPEPGQPGVAVIAGHIDAAGVGPGALYHLASLKTGDQVEIVGSDGTIGNWAVSRPPQMIPKNRLPTDLGSNTGPPVVAIVTCGGRFNSATGHYIDNVIVWAAPAS